MEEILHQLRLVVEIPFLTVFYTSHVGGAGDFWTISSISSIPRITTVIPSLAYKTE